MNSELQKECFKTADKILNFLDELGYTTEKVPAYPNLLRDLVAIEVKRTITRAATAFFVGSDATEETDVHKRSEEGISESGGCCGGGCGCHDEPGDDTDNGKRDM